MEILIIGAGFVGTTTAVTFAEMGHKVVCVDTDEGKIACLKSGKPHFFEPGLKQMLTQHLNALNIRFSTNAKHAIEKHDTIFICVGTPSKENGDADLTYVKQAAQSIGRYMKGYRLIINKSTAPVGTCTKIQSWISGVQPEPHPFDVVSNPEFLREGSALHDALHPHRVVIGSESERPVTRLRELYEPLGCPIIMTNPNTAELIKYASNSFLATKISYMNQLARLCDTLQVSVKEVAFGMGSDPRIGGDFLGAGVGYGGSCFPKDVSALLEMAENYDVTLSILREVKQANESQRAYFIDRASRIIGSFEGKVAAVFGLAFKPNTSDTRESPALSIIHYLADHDAVVHVHDPVAILPSSLQRPSIQQFKTPEEAANGADIILICTDWPEYRETINWQNVKSKMHSACILDGRNMLDARLMESLGFSYHGIGYPH